MAFPDDASPVESHCEICGVKLGDEVVIQEFADGSLARLCPECAAGAALEEEREPAARQERSIWPDEQEDTPRMPAADNDPLERTREILMPVSDLIALQNEMQGALERLAASLELFATEYITEAQGKTAAESRLRLLEHELDKTRSRLQNAELSLSGAMAPAPVSSLIPDAAAAPPSSEAAPAWSPGSPIPAQTTPVPPPVDEEPLGPAEPATPVPSTPADAAPPEETPASQEASASSEMPESPWEPGPGTSESEQASAQRTAAEPPEPAEAPLETVPGPAASDDIQDSGSFQISEVQVVQRYYNESPFISRVRDVHRSLGKPRANLTKVPGGEPRVIVTVAWDIVWYQYLVYLKRDLPSSQERVVLHREGMDLDELAYYFKERNATINDDGRLDASELEVRLLSDPSALITDMTDEERRLLEDATEEIWDQSVAPEFKWDD